MKIEKIENYFKVYVEDEKGKYISCGNGITGKSDEKILLIVSLEIEEKIKLYLTREDIKSLGELLVSFDKLIDEKVQNLKIGENENII